MGSLIMLSIGLCDQFGEDWLVVLQHNKSLRLLLSFAYCDQLSILIIS